MLTNVWNNVFHLVDSENQDNLTIGSTIENIFLFSDILNIWNRSC